MHTTRMLGEVGTDMVGNLYGTHLKDNRYCSHPTCSHNSRRFYLNSTASPCTNQNNQVSGLGSSFQCDGYGEISTPTNSIQFCYVEKSEDRDGLVFICDCSIAYSPSGNGPCPRRSTQ